MSCMLKLNALCYSMATEVKTEEIGGQDMCSEWNRKGFPSRAKDEIHQAKGNREGQILP